MQTSGAVREAKGSRVRGWVIGIKGKVEMVVHPKIKQGRTEGKVKQAARAKARWWISDSKASHKAVRTA